MKTSTIKITLLMAAIMPIAQLTYATSAAKTKPIPAQPMASIQEAADKLMYYYNNHVRGNKYSKGTFKVGIPKITTPLPQCAVPLQATWPKEPEANSNPLWDMEVRCPRTVAGAKVKNWLVILPTDRIKTFVDQNKPLREIKDKAAELMERYNRQHKTNWASLEPNAKILVPYCAVPLKAEWQYAVTPIPPNWNINVICSRTVPNDLEKKWEVLVPTNRPRHGKYK